jgi:hypothetical protein
LVRSDFDADFYAFVGRLARPELFERLLADWAPGEPIRAESLLRIALVNRLEHPAIARHGDTWRAEAAAPPDDERSNPLDLRCRNCGRSYRHEIPMVLLDPDKRAWDSIRIPKIVLCKRCGSMDEWDLTPSAMVALTLRMASKIGMPDICAGKLMVETLGRPREFRTMGDAIRHGEAELARRGEDPDVLRAIGNLYRNGGLSERSIPFYERALAARPGDSETLEGLELARKGQGGPELAEPLRREREAGRNDPCPCGSGNKFKRCCLTP